MNKQAMVKYLKRAKDDRGLTSQKIAEILEVDRKTIQNWLDPKQEMCRNPKILKRLEPVLGIDSEDVFRAGVMGDTYNPMQKNFPNVNSTTKQGERDNDDDSKIFRDRFLAKLDEADALKRENDSLKAEINRLQKENERLKKGKN